MTQITVSTVNMATPVFIQQLRFRVFELQIRRDVFGSQRPVQPTVHILTTYNVQYKKSIKISNPARRYL
jgi:hypothetical protein